MNTIRLETYDNKTGIGTTMDADRAQFEQYIKLRELFGKFTPEQLQRGINQLEGIK